MLPRNSGDTIRGLAVYVEVKAYSNAISSPYGVEA
ncbi:hypothetical protein QOZ91_001944 [Clostridium sardiniense]|nr:hypothetical protein [Clostridium sardiniense]